MRSNTNQPGIQSVEGHSSNQEQLMRNNYFFYPKKSFGWLSLLLLTLLFAFLSWVAFLSYRITGGLGALVSIGIFIILAICGILLLIWFFNMKYELSGDKLVLHFGPFAYQIDLYLVNEVEIKSLVPSLGIGVIVPGFAQWVNSYRGEGKIFMCSTRAMKDIVLIRTKSGIIGISPQNEAEFIEEINKRVQFIRLLEPE
ncbi:PH domain-containing protein [Natranaerobius thermophilus]|uniref:Bacterial Pleckstrin homology domain-containing protein n=1 Tax=Natranaerobius thermophilus (strain ATCC BAA-1301 / DSM 18059 / JW/NM-WN-LF) TaxID=457570 RepID=B2A671_NATTJ|nr:PH domain-containing protein [Natranaerobius thermophilus]ACB84082.1 hypothetical protein Nther_0486 [Natranaerobius thermophilus JW/NM-WN-LF]